MVIADETDALMDAEYPLEGESVSVQESINEEGINRVSVKTSNSVTNTPYVMDVASSVKTETCGQSLDISDEGGELTKGKTGHTVAQQQNNFVLAGQVGGHMNAMS